MGPTDHHRSKALPKARCALPGGRRGRGFGAECVYSHPTGAHGATPSWRAHSKGCACACAAACPPRHRLQRGAWCTGARARPLSPGASRAVQPMVSPRRVCLQRSQGCINCAPGPRRGQHSELGRAAEQRAFGSVSASTRGAPHATGADGVCAMCVNVFACGGGGWSPGKRAWGRSCCRHQVQQAAAACAKDARATSCAGADPVRGAPPAGSREARAWWDLNKPGPRTAPARRGTHVHVRALRASLRQWASAPPHNQGSRWGAGCRPAAQPEHATSAPNAPLQPSFKVTITFDRNSASGCAPSDSAVSSSGAVTDHQLQSSFKAAARTVGGVRVNAGAVGRGRGGGAARSQLPPPSGVGASGTGAAVIVSVALSSSAATGGVQDKPAQGGAQAGPCLNSQQHVHMMRTAATGRHRSPQRLRRASCGARGRGRRAASST